MQSQSGERRGATKDLSSIVSGTVAALVLAGYLLGSLSTAYYLVRIRTGGDIRTFGSGTAGSTNVGRALGASGFAVTFLGDAAKGALAVLAARYFELGPWGVVVVILAVVAGQVWPVHLGFKGGKGLATAVGAILLLDYRLMMLLGAVAALVLLLLKRRMLSGLVAVALVPGVAALLGHPHPTVLGLSAVAMLLLFAHRSEIRGIIGASRQGPGGPD